MTASTLAAAAGWVASIPSPSSNSLKIGPLTLNYYGLCIGLGIVAAVVIAQRRWRARGGHADDIYEIAKWAVPAGVVGSRVYHIITDWRSFEDWIKIWEGGLGIPGGLAAGIGVGYLVARRRVDDMSNLIDAVIPGIPVAQAIGRFGNWFNQEIFGGPSDLPWAVEIDQRYRPAAYRDEATFHPAFLYEATWNLLLAGFLVWIDRRGVLKRGMILPLYVGGYGIGRFLVESVRIDPATLILGVRVNHWVSGAAVVLSALTLLLLFRRAKPSFFAPAGQLSPSAGDGSPVGDDGADTDELANAPADAGDDSRPAG